MRRFRILFTLIILTMIPQSDVPERPCGLSFQESGSIENSKRPGRTCDPSNPDLQIVHIPQLGPPIAQLTRENRKNERREIAEPEHRISNHESIRKITLNQMPVNLRGLSEIPCAEPDAQPSNLAIREIRSGSRETEIVLLDINESPPAGNSCLRFEIAGNDHLLPLDLLIHGFDSEGQARHYYLDWNERDPNKFGLYTSNPIMEGTIYILHRRESLARFDLKPSQEKGMIVLEIEKGLKNRESLYSYAEPDR